MGILGRQDYMTVPVQVTSITSKAIANVKSPGSTVIEAVTLDPAVRSRGGNAYNDITLRGFNLSPHDFYVDGIPGLMCQSSIPENFIERIDVISGPSTLTNGFSSAGKSTSGAVDLIPKKAGEEPIRRFTETFSGRGHWEEAIDIGQRFGDHKEWGVRLNADYADGTTMRKKEDMQTGNIFLNVDYNKDRNRANFFYGYFHVNEMAPDLPLNLGDFDIPSAPDGSANFQASWANYAYTNNIMGLSFEHDFTNHLTWYIKGGYHDENWYHCFESYYPELTDNQGNFKSGIEEVPIRLFRKSVVTGFKGDFNTGAVHHNAVLSWDKSWYSGWWGDWAAGNDFLYHGNIYNNSIENSVKPEVDQLDWGPYNKQVTEGLSFIDTLKWNRLTVLAGVRYQKDKTAGKYDADAVIPSFGLMYKLNPTLSVYGNWVQGVTPGSVVPGNKGYANPNDVLDPAKTTQREVGVKWDHGNLGGTASYFYVSQQLPMEDLATHVYDYNGTQQSKGFEVTVFGEPTKGLHLMGGFMYMKTKNEGGTYDGNLYHGSPDWNATLALQYDFTDAFSMTSRWTYNSAAWADDANTKRMDSWIRWDVGAKYTWSKEKNPMTLSVNVLNVLNHKYWYGAGNNSIYLGMPRTAVVSLSMDF